MSLVLLVTMRPGPQEQVFYDHDDPLMFVNIVNITVHLCVNMYKILFLYCTWPCLPFIDIFMPQVQLLKMFIMAGLKQWLYFSMI